jgi:hypothetical protein
MSKGTYPICAAPKDDDVLTACQGANAIQRRRMNWRRWLFGPAWQYLSDSKRTDPETGRVENYELCPSGWPGGWVKE